LATHSDRLSAIRLLYAMPIFLTGAAVGTGVGAAGWAAGEHAARSRATPTQIGGNIRRILQTGYMVSWHARCTAGPIGGLSINQIVRRSRNAFLSATLLLGLVLSACSGGASNPQAPATSAPASTSAAVAKPTPDQPTGTPAAVVNPAAQPASPPAEQRSVQAGGDTGAPVSEAPAAPIVQRSKTTGRPITLEVWLTDWEQSTQQLFNDQLVPAYEAAHPDTAAVREEFAQLSSSDRNAG